MLRGLESQAGMGCLWTDHSGVMRKARLPGTVQLGKADWLKRNVTACKVVVRPGKADLGSLLRAGALAGLAELLRACWLRGCGGAHSPQPLAAQT